MLRPNRSNPLHRSFRHKDLMQLEWVLDQRSLQPRRRFEAQRKSIQWFRNCMFRNYWDRCRRGSPLGRSRSRCRLDTRRKCPYRFPRRKLRSRRNWDCILSSRLSHCKSHRLSTSPRMSRWFQPAPLPGRRKPCSLQRHKEECSLQASMLLYQGHSCLQPRTSADMHGLRRCCKYRTLDRNRNPRWHRKLDTSTCLLNCRFQRRPFCSNLRRCRRDTKCHRGHSSSSAVRPALRSSLRLDRVLFRWCLDRNFRS
jgi:hypothetical protein